MKNKSFHNAWQIIWFVLLTMAVLCGFRPSLIAQQSSDSLLTMSTKLSNQYLETVSKKSEKVSREIDKKTEKYLTKLEKQETKLKNKLCKLDSSAANKIFADSKKRYLELHNRLKDESGKILNKTAKYMPWLDSANTSLKFLENNPLTAKIGSGSVKLKTAINKINTLKSEFKQAANVKDFIRQRKEYLSEQLHNYDLGNELKKYNKTAYYYSQQINDYRQAVSDPEKAEKKALQLLNKLPAFQQFMRKNSMLASLFAAPTDGDEALSQGMQGLQTRASVQGMIQTQLANGGPNAQAMFQQNMQEAQAAITSIKDRIAKMGNGGGNDLETPDFKPNVQKTKPFLKRLEYGTNIQSAKSSSYFPTTTDIGLSVGYKLNEKNMVGIGASYKMGWGRDIKHIDISNVGIGFRSFFDMKLKGSFYASGGLEYNYQQPFGNIEQIKYLNDWQQSGLIGISKIVSLKTKYFKKTKLQFLWDVLSYQQVPKAQPFKFRVGYSFNN